LTTIGLFMLRAKRPDVERPYRAVGYPFLPALYIALTTAVMLLILLSPSTRQDAFLGLVIVLIGIPVYFIWRAVEPAPARQ
jgi:basic amino acid/polyamine antiporter, APA family